MIEKIKEELKSYDIEVKTVDKSNLHKQVGISGIAYCDFKDKGEEAVSLYGTTLNDDFGMYAVSIQVIGYPIDKEELEKFRGGTFIFLMSLTDELITGNLFKLKNKGE